MTTHLVYLLGRPGVGKYSIAKEMKDYKLCDNHLINNAILALLPLDNDSSIPKLAWDYITKIREVVLSFIASESKMDYVFTNNLYENDFDRKIYSQIQKTANKRKSIFIPVMIHADPDEHKRRIQEPERQNRIKTINPADMRLDEQLIKIEHPNLLELDVTNMSASEAAQQILRHIESIDRQEAEKIVKFKVDKLTRDGIPSILRGRGIKVVTEQIDSTKYLELLKSKLKEEILEVINAATPEEIQEEIADVTEALRAFAVHYKIPYDDIEKVRVEKKNKEGGFEGGAYIDHVELPANHPTASRYRANPHKYPEVD